MAIKFGVPKLTFTFRTAAEETAARLKNGVVALIVQDATATEGLYSVATEADIPAKLSADNADYVRRALIGSRGAKPSRVYVSVISAAEKLVSTGAAALAAVDFDYLAGPANMATSAAKQLMDWLLVARQGYCIGKLVAADHVGDNMACINFSASNIVAGGKTYAGAAYCSRIAGILASTDLAASATYAPLPEVTAVAAVADPDAAVDAGKLILLHDGKKAKLCRAVNSMTTLAEGVPASLRKIKMVEAVDLIRSYAMRLAEDRYIGQKPNSYDNKLALVAELQAYLQELETAGVLASGSGSAAIDFDAQRDWLKSAGVPVDTMTDPEILSAETGSHVFITLSGTILDAMEDFAVTLTMGGAV